MSYDENEEDLEDSFKVDSEDDELLDMGEDALDFGLDEEDPDKDR